MGEVRAEVRRRTRPRRHRRSGATLRSC
jgi:hypothetical protein